MNTADVTIARGRPVWMHGAHFIPRFPTTCPDNKIIKPFCAILQYEVANLPVRLGRKSILILLPIESYGPRSGLRSSDLYFLPPLTCLREIQLRVVLLKWLHVILITTWLRLFTTIVLPTFTILNYLQGNGHVADAGAVLPGFLGVRCALSYCVLFMGLGVEIW